MIATRLAQHHCGCVITESRPILKEPRTRFELVAVGTRAAGLPWGRLKQTQEKKGGGERGRRQEGGERGRRNREEKRGSRKREIWAI